MTHSMRFEFFRLQPKTAAQRVGPRLGFPAIKQDDLNWALSDLQEGEGLVVKREPEWLQRCLSRHFRRISPMRRYVWWAVEDEPGMFGLLRVATEKGQPSPPGSGRHPPRQFVRPYQTEDRLFLPEQFINTRK